MNIYYVYILSNWKNNVFYTGVTNDLHRRIFEHKIKLNEGFTSKYKCDRLLYYEEFNDISEAIRREKQVKKYKQIWKANLVNSMNPEWRDLSKEWYKPEELELSEKLKIAAQGRDDTKKRK